jgi:hypothetical protein
LDNKFTLEPLAQPTVMILEEGKVATNNYKKRKRFQTHHLPLSESWKMERGQYVITSGRLKFLKTHLFSH